MSFTGKAFGRSLAVHQLCSCVSVCTGCLAYIITALKEPSLPVGEGVHGQWHAPYVYGAAVQVGWWILHANQVQTKELGVRWNHLAGPNRVMRQRAYATGLMISCKLPFVACKVIDEATRGWRGRYQPCTPVPAHACPTGC